MGRCDVRKGTPLLMVLPDSRGLRQLRRPRFSFGDSVQTSLRRQGANCPGCYDLLRRYLPTLRTYHVPSLGWPGLACSFLPSSAACVVLNSSTPTSNRQDIIQIETSSKQAPTRAGQDGLGRTDLGTMCCRPQTHHLGIGIYSSRLWRVPCH